MFFSRAGERESLYESRVKKEGSLLGTAGNAAGGVASAVGGILGGIGKALGGIGGGLFSLGSSIVSGLVGILGSTGGAIFKVIGGALSMLGPWGIVFSGLAAYLIYEFSKQIQFKEIGDSIKKFFTDGSFLQSMYGGARSLDEVFGTNFFVPMIDKTTEMFVNIYNTISDFTFKAKYVLEDMAESVTTVIAEMAQNVALALGLGVVGGLAGEIILGRSRVPRSLPAPGGATPQSSGARSGYRTNIGSAFNRAAGAAAGSSVLSKGAAVAARIFTAASRSVVAGAILRVTGGMLLGPVGIILGVGLTIYQIRDILKDADVKKNELDYLVAEGLLTSEEKQVLEDILDESTLIAELSKPNLPAADISDIKSRLAQIESRAPAREALSRRLEGNLAPTYRDLKTIERDREMRAARLTFTPDLARRQMTDGGREGRDRGTTSPSRLDTEGILATIRTGEGGSRGYEAVNRGRAGDTPGGYPGLTNLTVDEVLRKQSSGEIFAAGAYQIIPKTLMGLMTNKYGVTGVSGSDKFNAETQDKLAKALLMQRIKNAGGENANIDELQRQIASEWAIFADPATGRSVYDRRAGNSANLRLTSELRSRLSGLSSSNSPSPAQNTPRTPSVPDAESPSLFQDFGNMLAALFSAIGATNESIQQVAAATARSNASGQSMRIPNPYDSQLFETLLNYHTELGTPVSS
jgi:hypothetical protein